MAESIKAPRGVRDILPEESGKWAWALAKTREVAELFQYSEVYLPLFEHTELFARGVGDTTDIVEKEMYTFEDKGGRSITLRPELTASMVRSYLEQGEKAYGSSPRLWSYGPMFRYERPQKGRYRQFYQLDFEVLNDPRPTADLEVIMTAITLFDRLGMKNLEVVLNSVGCPECRPVYRQKLLDYLEGKKSVLCENCMGRMTRNPLRVLDCKVCHPHIEDAPDIFDSLCPECAEHFDSVKRGLDALGVNYSIDKTLVRGLDYYTKTAFEIKSGDLGAQSAVCGGGRYDNLAEAIGGGHVPSVGFAAGFDRVILVMEQQGCSFGPDHRPDAAVFCLDDGVRSMALRVLADLRGAGLSAYLDDTGRGMKARMKTAVGRQARLVLFVGSGEAERGVVTVKNLDTTEQREIPSGQLSQALSALLG